MNKEEAIKAIVNEHWCYLNKIEEEFGCYPSNWRDAKEIYTALSAFPDEYIDYEEDEKKEKEGFIKDFTEYFLKKGVPKERAIRLAEREAVGKFDNFS